MVTVHLVIDDQWPICYKSSFDNNYIYTAMKITEMGPCNQSSVMATSSIQHMNQISSTTNYLISAHLSAQQHYCQQSNQGQGTLRAVLPLTAETNLYSTTGYKNLHVEV